MEIAGEVAAAVAGTGTVAGTATANTASDFQLPSSIFDLQSSYLL